VEVRDYPQQLGGFAQGPVEMQLTVLLRSKCRPANEVDSSETPVNPQLAAG
jgi:hypothetical protein